MGHSASSAREALREAIAQIEGSGERTPPGRVRGAQWSILDHHEHDGRRYIVAVETTRVGLAALSFREREVVAAAAAGQSNKIIAYDLSLSDSTVRVLLSRAAQKLGVKRRRELVAVYLAYLR